MKDVQPREHFYTVTLMLSVTAYSEDEAWKEAYTLIQDGEYDSANIEIDDEGESIEQENL